MRTNTTRETTLCDRIAVRLGEPILQELRARDRMVWSNPRHWKLGFYFGRDDSRLWVPRRCGCGAERERDRIINFGHPQGRKAFWLLMFGYGTGLALLGCLVAAALGVRW